MNRRPVLVLIHGILSGMTAPSWVDRFEQWLWKSSAQFEVIKRHYAAGPFPMWNVWVKNWWIAARLADDLESYAQDGAELHFVTHSNGADIALKVIRILATRGYKTTTAIFVGAAISVDIGKNRLYELHQSAMLERCFAYCSREDLALRWRVTWPYGHLGRLGFRFGGVDDGYWNLRVAREQDERGGGFFTRWFPGYGHTGYWSPEHELSTFQQIRDDLWPIPF